MWTDRRWRAAGLVASILLNVFLVGIVAGHVYSSHKHAAVHPAKNGPIVRPARVRELPEAERKIYRGIIKSHRDAIEAAEREVQAVRMILVRDIAAPAFDRGTVDADFAALRRAASKLQEQYNAAAVDALAGLTPASRAAIVGHPAAAGPDTR